MLQAVPCPPTAYNACCQVTLLTAGSDMPVHSFMVMQMFDCPRLSTKCTSRSLPQKQSMLWILRRFAEPMQAGKKYCKHGTSALSPSAAGCLKVMYTVQIRHRMSSLSTMSVVTPHARANVTQLSEELVQRLCSVVSGALLRTGSNLTVAPDASGYLVAVQLRILPGPCHHQAGKKLH